MLKVQSPLKLKVISEYSLDTSLIRTAADDAFCDSPPIEITHKLNTQNDLAKMAEIEKLVALCMGECEKLQNCSITSTERHLHLIHVQQAVKALIIQLNEVEIFPISNASIRLAAAVNNSSGPEDVKLSIDKLRAAINDLVHLYKISWTDLEHNIPHQCDPSNEVHDPLSLQVISLHQVPENYLHSLKIEYLWIAVSIIRGDRASCCRKSHTGRSRVKRSLFPRVLWDQQLTLNFSISQLPLDATLFIELYGTETVKTSKETPIEREHELSSAKIPLFDFKRRLLKGESLFRLEKLHEKYPEPIIYIELPYHCIQFPEIAISSPASNPKESPDWPLALKLLQSTYEKKNLTDLERQLIWRNRSNAMRDLPEALPFILRCVDNWNAETLSEVSGLLSSWPTIKPLIALSLLTKEFMSVQFVRDFAIKCLKRANESVLLSVLTQLVSLLQYEKTQDSVLAVFLLERAWNSIRITFHLHAALITAADHTAAPIFYVMQDLLEWSSGAALKAELTKTQKILNIINFNALRIKDDRSNYLQHFESLWNSIAELSPFRLAEFPTVEFVNIVISKSKPFSSFTAPLLLTLEAKNGERYSSIYKNGDDLRQDQLVTSLFHMMENFWLSQGLDLRMLGYSVYPTAKNCGFIEIVQNSVTLRQVQVGNNQKERCLHDWLAGQRNNKFELIDNFSRSCAAYSVATYILGLGDRHNDNIMITRRGHMFHIDFNKAFGHYQKIGGVINRDRAPFVLSDDMVLVINHGATMETGRKFPAFVQQCAEAYNIARHHWREIISMIMVSAPMNMTALKEGGNEVQVVFENLSPTIDDIAAQEMFFNRVKKSYTSFSTRLNFFMHTFAQLFQTGGWDGVEPLPDPVKYTVQEVGRPIDFEIEGFEMKFRNTDKFYSYRLRVRWPNRTSFILRSWIEFTQIRSVIEKFQIERGGEPVPPLGKLELSTRGDKDSVAIARKSAIFDFLQFANAEAQVRDHPATITFLYEDEKRPPPVTKSNSIPTGSRQGYININMFFEKDNYLKILVKNCFDLPSSEGRAPESYVKVYIRDESGNNIKSTKQKTTTEYSHNPVFNKVFHYDLEDIPSFLEKDIEISVWNYSGISASNFMIGRVILPLKQVKEGYLELLSP
ncbi:Oidioi.mRNA.OKI2018_I69.chr1.g3105.t1.cds [Oikopleura dioica]|nr:Oidioi.mRNA.OKI2018_I69.chr1.g3105.t1.cds [Oikopleura dioica]